MDTFDSAPAHVPSCDTGDTLPAPPLVIDVPSLAAPSPKKRGRPAKASPPPEGLFAAAIDRNPFSLAVDYDTAEGFSVNVSVAGGESLAVAYSGPSDRLLIQALRQRAENVSMKGIETVAASIPEGAATLALDAGDAGDALAYLAPAMSKDATRYNLSGVYFDANGNWVATDGIRLHMVEGVGAIADWPGAIVPAYAVKTLQRAMKATKASVLTMARDTKEPAFIFFRLAGPSIRVEYRVRLVDGQFPAYQQAIPTFDRNTAYGAIIDGRDIPAAIEKAPVYLDKVGNKLFRLVFDQALLVRAHDDSMTRLPFLYPFEWNQKGVPSFVTAFEAGKFADLFDTFDGAVAISMADDLSPLLVRNGRKTGVLMPVRA